MIFRIQHIADPKLLDRLDNIELAMHLLRHAVTRLAQSNEVDDADVRRVRNATNDLRGQQNELQSAVTEGQRPATKE